MNPKDIHNLMQKYAKKAELKKHVRCMIDGWLTNPKFVFLDALTWQSPGDMKGALSICMQRYNIFLTNGNFWG